MSVLGLLGAALIILKLLGKITIGWFFVFLPWVAIILWLIFIIVLAIVTTK